MKIIRKFIYWWNNPPEKKPKTKVAKPLTWRQEMEIRHFEIRKEAKAEKKRNKKDMDVVDPMIVMLIFFILFGASLFVVWGVIDSKESQTKREACESVGGSFEVVDQTYAGKVVVDIYGCVK